MEMDALWMALQPIVALQDGAVFGHEALVRGPAGSPWAEPAGIIREADQRGIARELEVTCRHLALTAGARLSERQRLFLNVDVRHPHLPLDAGGAGLEPGQVVVEVSEERDVVDDPRVLEALQHWKRLDGKSGSVEGAD